MDPWLQWTGPSNSWSTVVLVPSEANTRTLNNGESSLLRDSRVRRPQGTRLTAASQILSLVHPTIRCYLWDASYGMPQPGDLSKDTHILSCSVMGTGTVRSVYRVHYLESFEASI